MGDSYHTSSSWNLELPSIGTSRKASGALVASVPKTFKQKTFKNLGLLYRGTVEHDEYVGHITFFLLKVAALEVMRRVSRVYCPLVWRSLQALQTLCYPPFKWIQRWTPFKELVLGMQKLSRPLLFLSVATALSEHLEDCKEISDAIDDSQSCSEPDLEQIDVLPTQDSGVSFEPPQRSVSVSWLLQLYEELEHQNITLPERIDEDELRRFYASANGDFSCLLSSIKNTIHWRQSYNILSAEELKIWSHLVFWHGCDVKLRPCLFIRLGLACTSLASKDKSHFAQAIVSQIELGVLNLMNVEDPQITVVMDCEGITPLTFPTHMLKSCSALVQEHYPNRLCCLFIIRLPSIVRVIAQTVIQVLKPVTRRKLRIEGKTYSKVLSEYLQAVPSFLGGYCVCPKCSMNQVYDAENRWSKVSNMEHNRDFKNEKDLTLARHIYQTGPQLGANWEEVRRTAIIATLMVWIFIGFCFRMYKQESHS